MIGEKVTLRVRMSVGEAHYAGELVNGSHIVDFWGDVGTELAIRLWGDESLFLGYEHIRFTAPVYAGDFMEYTGWIEKVLCGEAVGTLVVKKPMQRPEFGDPKFQNH